MNKKKWPKSLALTEDNRGHLWKVLNDHSSHDTLSFFKKLSGSVGAADMISDHVSCA